MSMYHRSDSHPGRRCARTATDLPSGENTGVSSAAALEVVIFFASPPVTGTIQTSLFVVQASRSPPSRFETNRAPSRPAKTRCRRPRRNAAASRSRPASRPPVHRGRTHRRRKRDAVRPRAIRPNDGTSAGAADGFTCSGFLVVADVDVRHERDLRAVSREEQRRLHARGELRHLARLAAADIHDEHLRRLPGSR